MEDRGSMIPAVTESSREEKEEYLEERRQGGSSLE
jgi:hypothetical protein